MIAHTQLTHRQLTFLIKAKAIQFAGNSKLKIYGTLHCRSGKRMQQRNRVFFMSEQQARAHHYRPCGHCMKEAYQQWKTCCPTMGK